MPVCARCEGELIGIILALIVIWFVKPPLWLMGVFMVPMVVDGFVQALTKYESTNWRRLITGMLFGFGIAMIFLLLGIVAYRFGVGIGMGLRN